MRARLTFNVPVGLSPEYLRNSSRMVRAIPLVQTLGTRYAAGIAEAGTESLGPPASIRRMEIAGSSARRPAITHPAVPPLQTK